MSSTNTSNRGRLLMHGLYGSDLNNITGKKVHLHYTYADRNKRVRLISIK
jgi:hypothetical protein